MVDFLGRPPFNIIVKNILSDPYFVVIYFFVIGIIIIEIIRTSLKIRNITSKKILIVLYVLLFVISMFIAVGIYLIKF